ncbi:phosphonate ABC transporter, permease protein PhnE [Peptoniphilus equinus]|uniref:Phosphonate ABC transporter, permease protein PhnE n=1 Tax=Peptoniphilus equinus TaxID=3016343 RepID=A0ABY7QTZ6_9FIRM|nr:phosphonate ABC transporter, permease protein PhnE [Peptoniphilus equinus]WBW49363.1 phosphonate ABC transporter, permease protein PhnE [Peptoniphilus equinus]
MLKRKSYTVNGKSVVEKPSYVPLIIAFILVFTFVSAQVTDFSMGEIIDNFKQLGVILSDLFHPNFAYGDKVVRPLLDTVKMSFLGSFLGAFVALPFAFLAANNMIRNRLVNYLIKLLFSVIRTIPTLVSALIATYIFGLGTLAGTTAIFLFSFSYVGKLTYEQIESVDMGAYEAMLSMGYTTSMAFIKGIIPEIMPNFLSTSLFNFEGNVRYASILGYVGAGGLGLLINENINFRDYNNVGIILFMLLVVVFCIEKLSKYLRSQLS